MTAASRQSGMEGAGRLPLAGSGAITVGTLTLAEEAGQGLEDQVWCFLGQEVAGGQRSAADVGGVFPPHGERLVGAAVGPTADVRVQGSLTWRARRRCTAVHDGYDE